MVMPIIRARLLRWQIGRARARMDYARAFELLACLEAIRPLNLGEQIEKAQLLLGTDRANDAHAAFQTFLSRTAASPAGKVHYLRAVAKYWLAVIEGSPERALCASREAERSGHRGRSFRRFHLPPSQPRNPNDVEYVESTTKAMLDNGELRRSAQRRGG